MRPGSAPRSPDPNLTVSRLAQPPPGVGAPPPFGDGRRKSVRGRGARQLASRENRGRSAAGGDCGEGRSPSEGSRTSGCGPGELL
ncbi:hypothetical protein AAY473_008137 [Plecturocebus cupreus]